MAKRQAWQDLATISTDPGRAAAQSVSKGLPNGFLRASLVPATRIIDAVCRIAFNKGLAKFAFHHLNGTLYSVNGTEQSLWSNLGMLLAEHNMSVLALHKRLQENGVSVNLKSLYRLAVFQPLQKFDARIVKPVCQALGVDLSELISLEKPELILLKLDPVMQARITNLLDKGNQGTITKKERAELERLVDKAERISLHNARALVEYRRRRTDRTEGTEMGHGRRSKKERESAIPA
jgi:hypothetical protein